MPNIFEVLRNKKLDEFRQAPSFNPYSLKHWALASAVESVVKSAISDDDCPFKPKKCDIPLFGELKLLHKRGAGFLNYEFSFDGGQYSHYTLAKIIDEWEKHSISAVCWYFPIMIGEDRLKPSCSCRRGYGWGDININGHRLLCQREKFQ